MQSTAASAESPTAPSPAASRPGVCYGYEPVGFTDLFALRPGSGDSLVIGEQAAGDRQANGEIADEVPLGMWRPAPDDSYHARLYARHGAFDLWIAGVGWYHVDPERRAITLPEGADPVLREHRMWGIPAVLCFTHRGDLPLHSSAVEIDGRSLLFVAPGQFGKTTLSAGFAAQRHRLLNEDMACIRLKPEPAVVPGPPTLRLRSDVRDRISVPSATVIHSTEHRTLLLFDGHGRGTGDPVPLAGIVFLNVTETGEPQLTRVSPSERLPALWNTSFKLPDDDARSRCFAQVVELVGHVPLWDLHRPLRMSGLPALVDQIVDTCLAVSF